MVFVGFSEDIYRYSGQARSQVETQKIQQMRYHSNHTWELFIHSIILVRLLLDMHSSRSRRVYKEEQTEVATEHMEVIYEHRVDFRIPSLQQQRRRWHPTPVLLPGKSHGWRNLVGCSPWGCKESDKTE